MELEWDDLTEEQREAVKGAIDTLAILYPLSYGRPARKAWFRWPEQMIETRAPRVREPDSDPPKQS